MNAIALSPEWCHLICAVLGLVVGWVLRHKGLPGLPSPAPSTAALVQDAETALLQLLQQYVQKQQQKGQIQSLLQQATSLTTSPPRAG